MTPSVNLHGVALDAQGGVIDLRLDSRRSLAVFGPAGSGKSALLRVCAGLQAPARGRAELHGRVAYAAPDSAAKKKVPQDLAKAASGAGGASRAAEALGALGLWDLRRRQVSQLSPGQQAACDLLGPLSSLADVLVLDGLLDRLDPWAFRATLDLVQKRVAQGAILVLATNRPELAARTDSLVVLKDRRVAFAGSFRELELRAGTCELEVETHDQEGVRALCEPFCVELRESNGLLTIRAKDGQELAVKLLLEGYGDVRSVVLRSPTPAELLERTLKGLAQADVAVR